MKTWWPLVGLCLLLVPACGGDGPVAPGDTPPAVFRTPDTLMDRFRYLMADNSLDGFDALFRDDFRFMFSEGDIQSFDLPTEYLHAAEWRVAFANIFAGQSVENWRGESIPAVGSLDLENMERTMVWSPTGDDPLYPDALRARYWVQFRLNLDDGQPPFSFVSYLDFYCADQDTSAAGEAYRLTGLSEIFSTVETGASFSFGSLGFLFFTNEPPAVSLDFPGLRSAPEDPVLADACGSYDREYPQADLWYRWGPSDSGPWTFWGPHCDMEFPVTTEDPMRIHVEVRDRWGAVSQAGYAVPLGQD